MTNRSSRTSWLTSCPATRWLWLIRAFVVILASGYILTFGFLATIRLFYPYELEWIEGVGIDTIVWILEHHPLYAPPSIHFIPLPYPPLYYYLSAGLASLIGPGFIAPRLISILSTLGCFFLVYVVTVDETSQPVSGILATGIYAASFRFAGTWMDLAKVDSLFLFLILAGFVTSYKYRAIPGQAASGIIFVLALLTKQPALIVVLVLAPSSLLLFQGKHWLQWMIFLVSGALSFEALDYLFHGWFSFYTIKTVATHPRAQDWLMFWKLLLPVMWPSLLITIPYSCSILPQPKCNQNAWYKLAFSLSLILTSWGIYQKTGTYDNGLMPACLGLAIMAGSGLGKLYSLITSATFSNRRSYFLNWVATFLIAVQFLLLNYNPLAQLPGRTQRSTAQAIIERLKNLPGKVFVYQIGYVSHVAGKNSYLHIAALGDVLIANFPRKSDSALRQKTAGDILPTAVSKQVFDWVILYSPDANWLPYYVYTGKPIEGFEANYPVTRTTMVPESLMVKNPVACGGTLPLSSPVFDSFFLEGWGPAQPWGRWIMEKRATLFLAFEKNYSYAITLSLHSVSCQDQSQSSSIRANWNGETVSQIDLLSGHSLDWRFTISAPQVMKANQLQLIFEPFPFCENKKDSDPVVDSQVRLTELTIIQER